MDFGHRRRDDVANERHCINSQLFDVRRYFKQTSFPHDDEPIYFVPGYVLSVCCLPCHAIYCWRSAGREVALWKRFLRHSRIRILRFNLGIVTDPDNPGGDPVF